MNNNNKLHNHHKVMTNNKILNHHKVMINNNKLLNHHKVMINNKLLNHHKVMNNNNKLHNHHKVMNNNKPLQPVITVLPFGANVADKVSMVQLVVPKVHVSKLMNISTNVKIKLIEN